MPPSPRFGGFQPPPEFTKRLMIGIFVLAVIEIIAQQWIGIPLTTLLVWKPFGAGFQPWQILGNYFLVAEGPIQLLLNILMVYFFVPPIQRKFGRKGVIRLAAYTVGIASAVALLLDLIGAVVVGQASGIAPLLTAMFVVFGLSSPRATIMLFFILPVQAIWIAYGATIMAFLYFITSRDLSSALWLGGCAAGFAFMNLGKLESYRKNQVRKKHKAIQARAREKAKQKFTVYKGGKDDDIGH